VARFARLEFRDRTAALNRLIGPVDRDSGVMQWRALLITALREAKLWPYEEAVWAASSS
jgi:hypothetical protein